MFVTLPSITMAANISLPSGTGLPHTSVGAVIANVTRFVTGLIAVLTILMIIISGIMYITSAGDSGRVETAKGLLRNSVIGLVIALLAYAIVTAVGSALGAW